MCAVSCDLGSGQRSSLLYVGNHEYIFDSMYRVRFSCCPYYKSWLPIIGWDATHLHEVDQLEKRGGGGGGEGGK